MFLILPLLTQVLPSLMDLTISSLADFEVLELEIDELELDDGLDSDTSVMYGIYGSDWANDGNELD